MLRALKRNDSWSFQAHWPGREKSVSAHELGSNCSFNLVYVVWTLSHFLFPQPSLILGHLLVWPQSSCTDWPCNWPMFSSRFKQKTPSTPEQQTDAIHACTPSPWQRLSHTFLDTQPWHLPALDLVLTPLWVELAPCHSHLEPAPPGRHWEPWSVGPHIFSPPGTLIHWATHLQSPQDGSQAWKNVWF